VAVDATAVDALRAALAALAVEGRVVAGEGEKDEAPMLVPGERFGTGGPAIDLAVDPVDGTRLAASGRDGAMAVLAVTGRDGFADLGPAHYLAKQVTWLPDAAGLPIDRLVRRIADVRGVAPAEVRVAVQDRPRNADVAARARAAGATVVPFEHGDIERSLRAAQRGTDLDVVTGIGGAPEGVLTAAAVRALGADMVASYAPQSAGEAERLAASGRSPAIRLIARRPLRRPGVARSSARSRRAGRPPTACSRRRVGRLAASASRRGTSGRGERHGGRSCTSETTGGRGAGR
jgi:fructose-1,6-bisphosphatase II